MATAWSTQSSAQTPTTLGVGISTPVGTLHLIELQKQVDELKNLQQ